MYDVPPFEGGSRNEELEAQKLRLMALQADHAAQLEAAGITPKARDLLHRDRRLYVEQLEGFPEPPEEMGSPALTFFAGAGLVRTCVSCIEVQDDAGRVDIATYNVRFMALEPLSFRASFKIAAEDDVRVGTAKSGASLRPAKGFSLKDLTLVKSLAEELRAARDDGTLPALAPDLAAIVSSGINPIGPEPDI